MPRFSMVVCIVLDGVGVGEAPDAAHYGDEGSNSVGNTARAVGGLRLPNLARMGLGSVTEIDGVAPVDVATAHWGVMVPEAAGKDSTTGHWELMGCVLRDPLPTYPSGFPAEIIAAFESALGRAVLGNVAASGTEIISRLGEEHLATGRPIVYTSQDSVFQIAAHEDVVPPDLLYEWCGVARDLLVTPHGVGRVIARPFVGAVGHFRRTARRRDFSVPPPSATALDLLHQAGKKVLTIGKIDDLFAGRGITTAMHTRDNRDGMRQILEAVRSRDADFVFANLVDFDTMWGHRNDVRAYALGLEDFDSFLSELTANLPADSLLIITSDHGNDPTTPSTDHSRERVPLLVYHSNMTVGCPLGTRRGFSDVGATVADLLGIPAPDHGVSFSSAI